jgi:hypothetical protein
MEEISDIISKRFIFLDSEEFVDVDLPPIIHACIMSALGVDPGINGAKITKTIRLCSTRGDPCVTYLEALSPEW